MIFRALNDQQSTIKYVTVDFFFGILFSRVDTFLCNMSKNIFEVKILSKISCEMSLKGQEFNFPNMNNFEEEKQR